MCGIFGYVGQRPALPLILEGLERLEYRGYDSAGVAISDGNGFYTEKCAGRIADLSERINGRRDIPGAVGIGHTRWATHGVPNGINAHPHFSCDYRVGVVHNGIIENHAALRARLVESGHRFVSETDTETIVHLLEEEYRGNDPLTALSRTLGKLHGSYALAVLFSDQPGLLVGARRHSPLVVGVRPDGHFLASDVSALLPYTSDFRLVEDGQIVLLREDSLRALSLDLQPQQPREHRVANGLAAAQREGYPHFMLKEIHEGPEVVRRECAGRIGGEFEELGVSMDVLRSKERIVIAACGTAWHAGLFAKYALQDLAGKSVVCEQSSELRYSPPPLDGRTLLIAVSQSGETADTLQAVALAKERGATVLAVTNSPSSSLAREADGVVYNRAGIEIGVAATKTYLAQLTSLLLLSAKIGGRTDVLRGLERIPDGIEEILRDSAAVDRCADRFKEGFGFLYIGRRFNVPTAYEGALKMKEISYRHAEGHAAGEMKHGPLALVDSRLVTVAIAPKGDIYDKVASNVEEIRSRGGPVVAVVTRGDSIVANRADLALEIPETDEPLSPLLAVVPLQLLAYSVAARLGRDVDKPRNLAKSVTVE